MRECSRCTLKETSSHFWGEWESSGFCEATRRCARCGKSEIRPDHRFKGPELPEEDKLEEWYDAQCTDCGKRRRDAEEGVRERGGPVTGS